ncbi:kinetochore protein Spc25-like isoform X2 [Dendronephthya gigantea]|nr:kinetochore protein Spc25-like isoform X2 [Dendronephthya gigantea]
MRKEEVTHNVHRGQEKIKEIENKIAQNHAKLDQQAKDNNEQKNMISSIGKDLEMFNLQADQISKKNVLREKQLDDAKKQNIQEEQVIKKAKEKTMLKMNQYTKGISFFQDYLGFTFEKVDKDHLKFMFKYIDPNDPEGCFTFTVQVDENTGIYNIKDCSPVINQLADLTENLNKTNDFTQFVISVRQAFKELVCKV